MFAVLTISDRSSVDASLDQSGPLLQKELESATQLKCYGREIIPDDIEAIRSTVQALCHRKEIDLVMTTGGTGFGQRDCTPEAIKSLLEREAPGIVHLLLSSSLTTTPFAALSRPVAGVVNDTLVITLPGSTKAVKECVEALSTAGVLEHALELIRGGTGEAVHRQLHNEPRSTTQAHHAHHAHHHHSHDHHHSRGHAADTSARIAQDPTASVAHRQRKSPFPLISLSDAISTVLRAVPLLQIVHMKVDPKLRGHVLAEDVYSAQDVPNSATTNVDGYAMRSGQPPGAYLVDSPKTWKDRSVPIEPGHIYRINTGAPLPAGCDAVIMVEDTELVSTYQDEYGQDEEKDVKTLKIVSRGENVRQPGSDVRSGELVLSSGTLVTAHGGEVGAIAFVGKRDVRVYKKPVVALLSTGNELCDIQAGSTFGETESWGGIWDTNRPSLQTALQALDYDVVDLGIVEDSFEAHRRKLQSAIEQSDLVLTTGGSSMGSSDLLKPVIEDLGGTIHFGRVSVKPGKPTTFATVAQKDNKPDKVIFALPGNPASAIVCFNLFVVPALRKMGGYNPKQCQLPRVRVELQSDMRLDPRPEFHRVTIRRNADGKLKAFSTGGQRSSRMASLAGANGLVALPAWEDAGPEQLKAGELADAIVIGELEVE